MVHELCLQCNRMDQPGMMNVPLEFQLEHRMRTRTACSKCVLSKLASTRGLSAGQYAQDYYTPYQDSTGDGRWLMRVPPGVAFTTVTCVPDDPVLHSQLADVELKFEDEMWRCTNPGCTNTISSVAVQLCLRGPTVCESSHYLCDSCMTTFRYWHSGEPQPADVVKVSTTCRSCGESVLNVNAGTWTACRMAHDGVAIERLPGVYCATCVRAQGLLSPRSAKLIQHRACEVLAGDWVREEPEDEVEAR